MDKQIAKDKTKEELPQVYPAAQWLLSKQVFLSHSYLTFISPIILAFTHLRTRAVCRSDIR